MNGLGAALLNLGDKLAAHVVLAAAAITLLPGWARRELRLPVLPLVDPLAVRPAATVLIRAIGWFMAADPRETELTDRLLVE